MDNVPVKISENYKPPPRIYQLPQAIANRLLQPSNHYEVAPQYSYDFQLERKLLTKIPEWRHMLESNREARRERKERRERQRREEFQSEQKQLLGAVTYPSAEDLSSTESDEEDAKSAKIIDQITNQVEKTIVSTHTNSFHNILQPTVIPHCQKQSGANVAGAAGISGNSQTQEGNVLSGPKFTNVFNYKDFEDDTSSPFDNIELKSINDLDMLAQVLLHNTLKSQEQDDTASEQMQEAKDNEQKADIGTENIAPAKEIVTENCNSISTAGAAANSIIQDTANLALIENTKAALEKVNYSDICQLQNENIPNTMLRHTSQMTSNNYLYQAPTYAPYSNQQTTYLPYNQYYNGMDQLQYSNYNFHPNIYNNQNYPYASNCNGGNAYTNPTAATQFIGHNANNYLNPNQTVNATYHRPQPMPSHTHAQRLLESEAEASLKAKSVPDILKELRDEVRNAEIRRSRNYSCHSEGVKQEEQKDSKAEQLERRYYAQLDVSAQKLAKNISSMGFPLERVAKIALTLGADDKKIIEHLIPLSELMDLGFDEGKISEALVKFDNNKEKALDYLIT